MSQLTRLILPQRLPHKLHTLSLTLRCSVTRYYYFQLTESSKYTEKIRKGTMKFRTSSFDVCVSIHHHNLRKLWRAACAWNTQEWARNAWIKMNQYQQPFRLNCVCTFWHTTISLEDNNLEESTSMDANVNECVTYNRSYTEDWRNSVVTAVISI